MHQQKQYVANTSVNFSDFRFFVKPGDICRHHEDTGDFIIFRNGALMAKLRISVMALRSMMTIETQFFTEIKSVSLTPGPVPNVSVTIVEESEPEEIIIINDVARDTPPSPVADPVEEDDDEVDIEELVPSENGEGEPTIVKKKRKK